MGNRKKDTLNRILDGIGAISSELEDEWFLWEAVKKGNPLHEVLKWDLEDYRKFKAFTEIRRWYDEVCALYYKQQKNKLY